MAIKIIINKSQLPCLETLQDIDEKKKPGLWDNIRAKRKRGEPRAKPGDKDYPKTLNINEEELIEAVMEKLSGVLEEIDLDEAKPAKGKRFAKKVKGKGGRTRTVSYGQSGKDPPCPNDLSRKKWKCRGSKSMK